MPDRIRYRDALRVGEFRALFAAFTVSMLGTMAATLALTVLIYARTGSPLLAALTFTLMFVPYLVGGGLLSALIDRRPPRALMVGCDLGAAALTALMAVPGLPVAALLALLGAVSLLAPVSAGSRNALLPRVVGQGAYVPARSLFRIVAQSAQVFGNAAGGALLVVVAPREALALDALAFVGSAACVRFGTKRRAPLRARGEQTVPGPDDAAGRLVPQDGGAAASGVVRDSLAGLRAVFANRAVRRLLLLSWAVPALACAPEALAAPYVADLGGSAAAVGWWLVALPAGTVTGELLGVWLLTQRRQRRLVGPLAALTFIPQLAFLAEPGFAPALALLFCSGLASAYVLGLDGLVLDAAPARLQSRVLSAGTAGLMTFQGLGFGAAGAAGEFALLHLVVFGFALTGLLAVLALAPAPAPARLEPDPRHA